MKPNIKFESTRKYSYEIIDCYCRAGYFILRAKRFFLCRGNRSNGAKGNDQGHGINCLRCLRLDQVWPIVLSRFIKIQPYSNACCFNTTGCLVLLKKCLLLTVVTVFVTAWGRFQWRISLRHNFSYLDCRYGLFFHLVSIANWIIVLIKTLMEKKKHLNILLVRIM